MTVTHPDALMAWKPTDIIQPLHNAISPELVDRFDPVYVEYYNRYNAGRLQSHEVSIEEARKNPHKYAIVYGRADAPDIFCITEQKCPVEGGEITIRIFEPAPIKDGNGVTKLRGAYINFHGGGWVFEGSASGHLCCKRLVHELQGDLVAFDVCYRLAPEHKYPVPIQDCWAAFNWIRNQKANELSIDINRLSVGGISAGAHLAAVIAHFCRNDKIPLAFQSLAVPVCDLHNVFTSDGEFDRENCPYESYRKLEFTAALPMERMRFFHRHFLGLPRPPPSEDDWQISLNLAKNFTKLAPAIIFTAELDPLRDEGIVYYNKMKSAGNDITHIEFLGVPHAFTHLDAILDASKQYNQHVIDSLKRYIRK